MDMRRAWLLILGLGWYIAFKFGLFVGGGLWLDEKNSSTPLFTLIGTALSFVVIGFSLWKVWKKINP